ncbi:DUF3540 domain-containing protein [Bosea caraganae]|uniref:DUF3540 domain-containing protein n=1 Tax=Bosea caraganae TaxID=2763117 RepID=A0A370L7P4_9HYPH|nr:DUF3540 domain-containing protein [Bosea caraganae]RDJ25071.1 DUF3540 domain-containing protein [Bosea caraganae]RDJ26181.1 DUF3540 domain-containing protein [Bosea caraganae]
MMRAGESEPAALATLAALAAGAQQPCSLAVGRVQRCDEDHAGLTVEIDGRALPAQVAVGCLVRPIEDDRVLVVDGPAGAFVLSVLERTGPNYATLALPGHGNLAIEGETLSLTARQRLALKGERLDLQAKALNLIAEKTTWLSKAVTTIAERWRISAKSHETSADILTEKSLNRIAIVDQIDTLRAETRSVKITGVASETAQSKVIAVADDLRMDGKRITMG